MNTCNACKVSVPEDLILLRRGDLESFACFECASDAVDLIVSPTERLTSQAYADARNKAATDAKATEASEEAASEALAAGDRDRLALITAAQDKLLTLRSIGIDFGISADALDKVKAEAAAGTDGKDILATIDAEYTAVKKLIDAKGGDGVKNVERLSFTDEPLNADPS